MSTQLPIASLAEVVRHETLADAWRRVRRNGGGPGADGITLDVFARDLDRRLAKLSQAVASGRYRPGRLARHRIPKASGGHRKLAVPSIVDRVAQTAALAVLAPQLDLRMANESFAYRPGRSVGQALASARRHLASGLTWIVDADIEAFFDSVPHGALIQELAIWIEDTRLLGLIGLWLSAWGRHGRGLPQGAPLSPLLANLYLHPLDRLLATAGIAAVRYADDFILLCPSKEAALRACRMTADLLGARGLRLHRSKTRILHISEGVQFLGQMLGGVKASARTPALPPRLSQREREAAISSQPGLLHRALRLFTGAAPRKIARTPVQPRRWQNPKLH